MKSFDFAEFARGLTLGKNFVYFVAAKCLFRWFCKRQNAVDLWSSFVIIISLPDLQICCFVGFVISEKVGFLYFAISNCSQFSQLFDVSKFS